MPTIRDEAAVLRKLDYSETSQVVVLFTRDHGKVRAIAKGIKRSTKRRFAPGIDLLDVGTVTITARQERPEGLATITEWTQTKAFPKLRESLGRIYAALYALEVTGSLTEDWDPHPGLYDELVDALGVMGIASDVYKPLFRFQQSLLDAIGLQPRMDACASCGCTSGLTHFSSRQGGMLCETCAPNHPEKHPVSEATRQATAGLSEPATFEGSYALYNYHVSHLMGRPPSLAAKLGDGLRSVSSYDANGTAVNGHK